MHELQDIIIVSFGHFLLSTYVKDFSEEILFIFYIFYSTHLYKCAYKVPPKKQTNRKQQPTILKDRHKVFIAFPFFIKTFNWKHTLVFSVSFSSFCLVLLEFPQPLIAVSQRVFTIF